MTKWIVSTPLKGTDLMKNFVCFTEVELQKLLEQYPEAIVEMKDSHLEDHAPLPLTDDQQVVLEMLKEETIDRGNPYAGIYWLLEDDEYPNMSNKEFYQVLAAFAEWALEQEEE